MGKATDPYSAKQKSKVFDALAKIAPDLVNVNYTIPKNLSATELKKYTPDKIDEKEWIDACRYVAGTILEHQEQYVEWDKMDEEGVPIYSKTLREVLSNNYPILRKQMEKIGLIRMVKDYSHGSSNDHSKIFVLGEKYQDTGTKVRAITHEGIKTRIVRWKTEMWADQKKRLSEIYYVVQWLFKDGLEIDKPAAIKAIEQLEKMVLYNAKRIKDKTRQEKVIKNINRRYDYAKHLIRDWEKIVPQMAKIDKAGRLYNVLSGM